MKKTVLLLVLACFAVSGCATFGSKKMAKVQQGMSQEEVQAILGYPDLVKNARNSCGKDINEEVWHYFGTPLQIKETNKGVFFRDGRVVYAYQRL